MQTSCGIHLGIINEATDEAMHRGWTTRARVDASMNWEAARSNLNLRLTQGGLR